MKCKVINASKYDLERLTNNWLNDNDAIEITNVEQTESSTNGYVTLTIFYLDLKESRRKKLDQISTNSP